MDDELDPMEPMEDDEMLDPLEIEDEATMFKFDEAEEDPDDKFH